MEPRCEPPDQRALEQALRIDHVVVGALAEYTAQIADLPPGRRGPEASPPSARGAGDHALEASMQCRNGSESFFDRPIDRGVRPGAPQIAHHGQVVHYVAER
jgi:hypothetical protein